jgi:hypothetical protein
VTGARYARTVVRATIRALVDETPDITLEELRTALAARRVWQATARCGASFTATRSRANKTAHGTEQDRPDIVKRRESGSMASGSNLAFGSGLGFRRDSRRASLADANRHFPFCHICRSARADRARLRALVKDRNAS